MLSHLRTSFSRTTSALSLGWFSTTASSSSPSAAQLKAMSAKDLVEKAIANHKIAIFSKSYCPFCTRAKALLKTNYSEVPEDQTVIYELDLMDDSGAIQAYLKDKTGQRTVPNIFIAQQHIGGCDATVAAHERKQIAALLKQ